jgi:hypothetical protein
MQVHMRSIFPLHPKERHLSASTPLQRWPRDVLDLNVDCFAAGSKPRRQAGRGGLPRVGATQRVGPSHAEEGLASQLRYCKIKTVIVVLQAVD